MCRLCSLSSLKTVARMATCRSVARSLSTKSLIPPNLAASAPAAASTESVESSGVTGLVELYKRMPKGPAPPRPKASGPLDWYSKRYVNVKDGDASPIFHLIGGMVLFGYTLEYIQHHSASHDAHH
ncbi:ATP synthase f chain, mitochondrial precursor [Entomophthora muscae]|uniref:ATP synthase f chain, mitochondrial n=1 Tax=Entomophthora muscae TaxID=34485 RepID=A0ACC2T181_9FUNG|nr:ATP synthase f chain, mitochondrial precursor [Entomophthora muscae]